MSDKVDTSDDSVVEFDTLLLQLRMPRLGEFSLQHAVLLLVRTEGICSTERWGVGQRTRNKREDGLPLRYGNTVV
jgi:hypothetical protein